MDSANCVELEDYSSGDEMEVAPRRQIPQQRTSPDDPDFNIYINRLAEKKEKEMQFWYSYIRAYVPLMKLMLEDYKVKWESSQIRKYAKNHNPDYDSDDADYDSDTSNGSVTSCIDMGFPNGDTKPSAEIGSNKGHIRNGLYIFISYARGGWFYPEVKHFFRKELGVRCFRTPVVNSALNEPDDFRAMMKFKSDRARAGVFEVLCKRNMLRNFNFVCIDADENYFQDSVIENLKNTKGLNGLPRCFVTFKDRNLM